MRFFHVIISLILAHTVGYTSHADDSQTNQMRFFFDVAEITTPSTQKQFRQLLSIDIPNYAEIAAELSEQGISQPVDGNSLRDIALDAFERFQCGVAVMNDIKRLSNATEESDLKRRINTALSIVNSKSRFGTNAGKLHIFAHMNDGITNYVAYVYPQGQNTLTDDAYWITQSECEYDLMLEEFNANVTDVAID
jgi:hypothetical protein